MIPVSTYLQSSDGSPKHDIRKRKRQQLSGYLHRHAGRMETTVFPAFGSRYPSTVMGLDAFARTRYAEVAVFRERWDEVVTDTTARSQQLFSRSCTPVGDHRAKLLSTGSLLITSSVPEVERSRRESRPSTSLSIPVVPMFGDAELPVEHSRTELALDGLDLSDGAEFDRQIAVAPALQSLSLRRCILSADSLLNLPKLCPFLTRLDLSDAKGASSTALILTLVATPRLSAIYFNNCNYLFAPPSAAVHSRSNGYDQSLPLGSRAPESSGACALRELVAEASTTPAMYDELGTLVFRPPPTVILKPTKRSEGHADFHLDKMAEDIRWGLMVGKQVRGATSHRGLGLGVGEGSIGHGVPTTAAPTGFTLTSDKEVEAASKAGFSLGRQLAHALGVAPKRLQELSFSRCPDVDDAVIFALSGQTPGLVVSDTFGGAGTVGGGNEAAGKQAELAKSRQQKMADMRKRMGMDAVEGEGSAVGGSDSTSSAGGGSEALRAACATGKKGALPLYATTSLDTPLFLLSLDLTACSKVTDAALAFIGANCPNLTVLRLALCDQPSISDAGVASVAQGCPKLIQFDGRACSQLTNSSLVALVKNCPLLQRLCFAGVSHIDDAGLGILANSRCAASLLELDVTRCRDVTAAGVRNLLFKAGALARPGSDGVLNLTLTGIVAAEFELLSTTFTSVHFVCTLINEVDTTKGALLPTFQAPPKEDQFSSHRVFARYGTSTAGGAKKKAGKKK